MSESTFCKGLKIKYKNQMGHINFVSEEYLTLCISEDANLMGSVNILIYARDWNKIELLVGNRNSDEDR